MEKFISLWFRGWEIRGLKEKGIVKWLVLRDLCSVINHIVPVTYSKETVEMCPSRKKMKIMKEGRRTWMINPGDIPILCSRLTGERYSENKNIRELLNWAEKIIIKESAPIITAIPTEADVVETYYYNDDFPVTFRNKDGYTMVNATQMAKGFGKQPTEWLRLAATAEYRRKLVDCGESTNFDSQVITMRGRAYGATWIEKSLAMEFARWLSPDFSMWCNDKLSDLAAIGLVPYPQNHIPEPNEKAVGFAVPKNFEEALMLAYQQAKKLRENEHKVAYYDNLVENRDWFTTTRIADELQITPYQLHEFLHSMGIVNYYPQKKEWIVNQEYNYLQCDVPYYWTNKQGKRYRFGCKRRWSHTGREYVLNLWKDNNKL